MLKVISHLTVLQENHGSDGGLCQRKKLSHTIIRQER